MPHSSSQRLRVRERRVSHHCRSPSSGSRQIVLGISMVVYVKVVQNGFMAESLGLGGDSHQVFLLLLPEVGYIRVYQLTNCANRAVS